MDRSSVSDVRSAGRLKMTKEPTRDIGAEILEGIREIKRGVVGRVVTFSSVPRHGALSDSLAPEGPLHLAQGFNPGKGAKKTPPHPGINPWARCPCPYGAASSARPNSGDRRRPA